MYTKHILIVLVVNVSDKVASFHLFIDTLKYANCYCTYVDARCDRGVVVIDP